MSNLIGIVTNVTLTRALIPAMIMVAVPPSVRAGAPINEWCPVTPEEAAEAFFSTTYQERTIGLCCRSCLRAFERDPEAYLENLPEFEGQKSPAPSGATAPAGQEKPSSRQTAGWLGSFHVISIHFPIALILAAGLLELAGSFRGHGAWTQSGRTVYVLGALSTYPASILGWISASQAHYPEKLRQTLELHRWLGTTVPALATIGLLALLLHHRRQSKKSLLLYRFTLLFLVVVIPLAAHFGGALVHGLDYFSL